MTKKDESEISDDKIDPYRFLMEHGVETWEEFEKFKEDFPNSSDALIMATWSRILNKQHGAHFLGF